MTAPAGPPTTNPALFLELAGPESAHAWREFVTRYAPLLDERCRRAGLQPADADDIRQYTLARLARSLAGFRYDPARRFRGYLTRVVDNAIRTHWRELARRPGAVGRGGSGLPADLAALPAELDAQVSEELARVASAVEAVRFEVGPGAWGAFWLTAVDGLPGAEAAARLNKTPSAVYAAKCRVAARLRAALLNGLPGGAP